MEINKQKTKNFIDITYSHLQRENKKSNMFSTFEVVKIVLIILYGVGTSTYLGTFLYILEKMFKIWFGIFQIKAYIIVQIFQQIFVVTFSRFNVTINSSLTNLL